MGKKGFWNFIGGINLGILSHLRKYSPPPNFLPIPPSYIISGSPKCAFEKGHQNSRGGGSTKGGGYQNGSLWLIWAMNISFEFEHQKHTYTHSRSLYLVIYTLTLYNWNIIIIEKSGSFEEYPFKCVLSTWC